MSGKFFLDTNIFVCTFDLTAPAKAKAAGQLIRRASDTGAGIISYQVVQEFFNVALRRFTQPLSESEAEQYFVTVLRPLLAIHSSPAVFLEALRVAESWRISWYDSLIVAAALIGECETIYTEDLQHGRKFGGLRVQNPFA